MSSLLKLRRGSTVAHETFTGADGEVTFNTDTNALVTHDGATAGGFPHVKNADLAASSGSSLVGYMPDGVGAVVTTVRTKLREQVSVLDFYANGVSGVAVDPTGVVDSTLGIQAAINTGKRVYVPTGVYLIDPDVGIKLKSGTVLVGDGLMRTVFKAMPKGATVAELAAYAKGSIIKRDGYTVGAVNEYCAGCYLADFSVLLVHPSFNLANYRQIGIDLRNITRSVVERVSSGTITIPGAILDVNPNVPNSLQGYGFVCGTRGSADIDYCGGEVNTIRDCFGWGAYKNFVSDDQQICGTTSAAHATLLDNFDAQAGHELIGQCTQYAAGVVFKNLVIQYTARQPGNASNTVGVIMSGYGCQLHIKYAEMSTACDVMMGFGSASKNNNLKADYFSYTSPSVGQIYDGGANNLLQYQSPVDVGGGVFINSGIYEERFNKARRTVRAKFRWTGSAIEIAEGCGVFTVTRNGVGDYNVGLINGMPTENWNINLSIDTNASGHIGGTCIASQSVSSVRFYTYGQNGAVSTQLDPRWVYFSGSQE